MLEAEPYCDALLRLDEDSISFWKCSHMSLHFVRAFRAFRSQMSLPFKMDCLYSNSTRTLPVNGALFQPCRVLLPLIRPNTPRPQSNLPKTPSYPESPRITSFASHQQSLLCAITIRSSRIDGKCETYVGKGRNITSATYFWRRRG